MTTYYEPDRFQCQVIGQDKKRCTCIGTYDGGGLLRCKRHHQLYLRDKANATPIKKTVPR